MRGRAEPKTDGELFDYLHMMFGWGSYDEHANPGKPWWEVRAAEVGKIKRLRFQRKVSVADLAETARWCRRNNVDVRSHAGLYLFIADALRDRKAALQEVLPQGLEDAIELERAAGDPDGWADRMDRASDRAGVFKEWQRARGRVSNAGTTS